MAASDTSKIYGHDYFDQDTVKVARDLLGAKILRQVGQRVMSGMVVETEAYCGKRDSACHAFRGQTPRNAVMFGPAGFSYVYLIYGLHHMLNVVTESKGSPCAVLFRAVEPLQGQSLMREYRQCPEKNLTNGPGKLCQALNIDRTLNNWNLTSGKALWLEKYRTISDKQVASGPRIGIGYATEEDQLAPWRFWVT
ncbi:MAG: DNA-3-methyladenine glycosylase [Chloroflexota bacterium]